MPRTSLLEAIYEDGFEYRIVAEYERLIREGMPTRTSSSRKRKYERDLETIYEDGLEYILVAELLGERERVDRLVEDLTFHAKLLLDRSRASRVQRRKDKYFSVFKRTLEDNIGAPRTESEFMSQYRMKRESFHDLVNLIRDHPVFEESCNDPRSKKQAPPEYQLLVLLKFLGTNGSGASDTALASHFGIGTDTVCEFRRRALVAVLFLYDETVVWPSEADRRNMSSRIQAEYFFPNCVGMMDATLLPLEFKPGLYGECYLREDNDSCYALQMLVVCDDASRVTYFHCGWPASVPDQRVWRNCKLNRDDSRDYFSEGEYLLTDAAFHGSQNVVPAFSSAPGLAVVPANNLGFNTLLSRPFEKSKHCIGLLKGRFSWLKGISICINDKRDLQQILKYLKAAVILHNLLIDDPFMPDWITETFRPLDDDDGVNQVIHPDLDGPGGHERRSQLLAFFADEGIGNINID